MNYLSCVPGLLYREGGFFDASDVLADLHGAARSLADECVGIAELFPPFHYRRPVPHQVIADDPAFAVTLSGHYASYNDAMADGAASVVVRLGSGRVHGNVLYIASKGGSHAVYETHRPNDRPYVQRIDPGLPPWPLHAMAGPDGLNLFLGSAGTSNYGHWLVDDLPRAAAVALLQGEAAGRTIHIWITDAGEPMNSIRNESLVRFCSGFRIEVRVMPLNFVFEFEQLYYPTPVSYHPLLKSPEAMTQVAQLFAAAPSGRRLFVTRRTSHSRGLVNAAAVEERLAAAGFSVIDPEGMDFAAQATAFAEASIIVGSMGAAMTNTIFAAPGARLLYLAPQGWVEPFYWDLAAVRGHRYSACYGPIVEAGQPAHLSQFSIGMDQLDLALDDLLQPNQKDAAKG